MEKNITLTPFARQLRKNQTKEESLLWYRFLRTYKPRFHRQYIIGNYIVDFYCHKAKLVIELDGSQHYEDAGQYEDAKRDAYLQSLGLLILRIPNNAIHENFRGVCEYIDRIVRERM